MNRDDVCLYTLVGVSSLTFVSIAGLCLSGCLTIERATVLIEGMAALSLLTCAIVFAPKLGRPIVSILVAAVAIGLTIGIVLIARCPAASMAIGSAIGAGLLCVVAYERKDHA